MHKQSFLISRVGYVDFCRELSLALAAFGEKSQKLLKNHDFEHSHFESGFETFLQKTR